MTLLNDLRQNPIIIEVVIKDGRLHQMRHKDQMNALYHVVLKLCSKGVGDGQMRRIYKSIIDIMDPSLMPKVPKFRSAIQPNNWQDYLGDADMFLDYLEFFDKQILVHGFNLVLDRYFYNSPLSKSIGSQRLPVAYLALSVQFNLPEIMAPALSYMCTAYQDTSFLSDQLPELYNLGHLTAHEILIEQIRVDPRFSVRNSMPTIDGFGEDYKALSIKVLKHSRELLRNYVYLWKMPMDVQDALDELRALAAHMMINPAHKKRGLMRQQLVDIESGGDLLNTLNAINVLYPEKTCPVDLVRIQFLNLIYYYIIQGRPNILPYSCHKHDQHNHPHHKSINWISLTEKMLQNEVGQKNFKTISALFALQDAQEIQDDHIFSKVMSLMM